MLRLPSKVMANIRTKNMSDSDIVTYHLFSIYIGHKEDENEEEGKDEEEGQERIRNKNWTIQTQKHKATKIVSVCYAKQITLLTINERNRAHNYIVQFFILLLLAIDSIE